MSTGTLSLVANAESPKIGMWRRMWLPILAGPMRGCRWLPGSGGKILRLLLGTYEPDQTSRVVQELSEGSVFYDVGAAVGYYTVLAAPRVGAAGRVLAFEPDPKNAAFLRRHVEINRFTNVVVRQSAVGDRDGTATFTCGSGTGTGHLSDDGGAPVAICRLDSMVEEHGWPTHMKIDVEGAELEVLRGAQGILKRARPVIFLSTHGEPVKQACEEHLRRLGYLTHPVSTDPKFAPELVCVHEDHLTRQVAIPIRRAG